MSVVRDLILQADEDLRYPTSGELQSMVAFLEPVSYTHLTLPTKPSV